MADRNQRIKELREACERSLYIFARTVEPHRVYGEVHKELFDWWQYHYENEHEDCLDNLLALIPRDHQKSHCMAVLCAWIITKDPAVSIIYVSATSTLAEKQLYDIKNILDSKQYRILWPEMIHPEEGKRAVWNNTEICVDHPKRKEEGVRDSTVFAAGLTTNTTGLHCRILMKDDVVVPDNAYTADARHKVAAACSQLASVLTTGGQEFCVGTRYHPADHYQDLKTMKEEVFNDEGEVIDERLVYGVLERTVEDNGVFLWPKEYRATDGKPFGFDFRELARKKAKYIDKTQFFAQYYNNPNDVESQRIGRDKFVYYDKSKLTERLGTWYLGEKRLNIYAAVDFAYSISKKADFSAIVVIGVDHDFNIYVLDIDRFKTNQMETYFAAILNMQSKWGFRHLRPEITAAQEAIVEYIKDRAKKEGMALQIDAHRPNKYQGAKEERIAAALEPRYQNGQIFHYKGGYCSMLEEELMLENPPHDDLKDCLAIAVSGDIRKPLRRSGEENNVTHVQFNKRFGGLAF